uniref:Galectin n=2 Tax=Latimeria chalumnae TaxID=7897 RepID=M3XGS3_LATCH
MYVGEIKGGLKPAMRIIIMGIVHSAPKSLTVSLVTNSMDSERDIGLQLAVNFQDRSVRRNTKELGKWGTEEKNIPYFPFRAGDNFKMEILCEKERFRILVDGHQLCDFPHRIQVIQSLTTLTITGDVTLTKVA